MVQFGLGGLVLSSSAIACLMIVTGPDIIGALLWSVITAFIICFVISVQDRVPFAAANLSVASAAIKKHRQVIGMVDNKMFHFGITSFYIWFVYVFDLKKKEKKRRRMS
jgi:hypothetical protein